MWSTAVMMILLLIRLYLDEYLEFKEKIDRNKKMNSKLMEEIENYRFRKKCYYDPFQKRAERIKKCETECKDGCYYLKEKK